MKMEKLHIESKDNLSTEAVDHIYVTCITLIFSYIIHIFFSVEWFPLGINDPLKNDSY